MFVSALLLTPPPQIAVETHLTGTALRGTPAAATVAPPVSAEDAAADVPTLPLSDAAPPPPSDAAAAAAAARLPRKVNKKFSPTEHDSFSGPGGVCMTLEEVQQRIAADAEYVPPFWREKYEADAARNWDIFYSINSRNFFKVRCILSAARRSARPVTDRASPTTQDRRYLDLEFEELRPSSTLVCLPCSPPCRACPSVRRHMQLHWSRAVTHHAGHPRNSAGSGLRHWQHRVPPPRRQH